MFDLLFFESCGKRRWERWVSDAAHLDAEYIKICDRPGYPTVLLRMSGRDCPGARYTVVLKDSNNGDMVRAEAPASKVVQPGQADSRLLSSAAPAKADLQVST